MSDTTLFECRVCGNAENNRTLTAREMMFGSREEFDYTECAACGAVQISDIPSDLARHYPSDYLSFNARAVIAETAARRVAARFAGKYLLSGNSLLGKFIVEKKPWISGHFPPSLRAYPIGLSFDSRILDFGCGTGSLLRSLYYFGFRHLTGADAFIESDIQYPKGVTILKRRLDELKPGFDLIMLHHSFEHLPEPQLALEQIRRLMHEESYCLIRMPVLNLAWEKYRTNWVQMDPPRHLFLFRENGFREMAARAGMSVEHVYYDSDAFQFWGSEQYSMDIPLTDARSKWVDPSSPVFSAKQIEDWEAEAKALNKEGRGDMACFYLRKA